MRRNNQTETQQGKEGQKSNKKTVETHPGWSPQSKAIMMELLKATGRNETESIQFFVDHLS